eukprot:evm.model.NODE_31089_length_21432_cov_25.446669.5
MLDEGINATTCTSSFYCPPSTLIPVTRELAGNTYTFLQVRKNIAKEEGWSWQKKGDHHIRGLGN